MCWEIFACAEPYAGINNAEVRELLKAGSRLSFPEKTPPEMISCVNKTCWAENPNERGSMVDVSQQLEQLSGMARAEGNVSF